MVDGTLSWIAPMRLAVEAALKRSLPAAQHGLYAPVDYFYTLGGKRMRPILALLGHELFDPNWKAALPAANAVEIFHNFSLVHDDIMDEAPLRRGQQTVHEKWGSNQAILSGDAMLVLATMELQALEPALLSEVLPLFNRTALEVCEGQQMDMEFESRQDVSVEAYLEMIRLKTSVLLAAALQMGAQCAGASKADQHHLYQFGQHMGLSFQLRDDYLDAFGDSAAFGKQIGGDILSDKKTYLLIRAFEKAGDGELAVLNSHIGQGQGPNKVEAVKEVMTLLDVPQELDALSNDYYNKAMQDLEQLSIPTENTAHLRELAAWLLNRQT